MPACWPFLFVRLKGLLTLSKPPNNCHLKPSLARTVLASAALLVSLQAQALTLGRLNVLSSLGEPLRAEVELQDFNPTDATALRLLAVPATAYSSLGQENNALASGFEITLVSGPGAPRLLLSTRQPIAVAFVDFVVEANWPAGRSVREYTALFNDKPATPAKTPVPMVATPVAAASADPARSHVVKAGDTAGNIAKAYTHNDVTLAQMLLAMLRENPQAFVENNVNQLRAGAVLQIPQTQDAQSVAPGQALALLKLQNTEFQAWRQRMAQAAPTREVPSANRESSGSVTTPTVSAPAPAADKLTLSKGDVSGQEAVTPKVEKPADQAAEQIAKNLETREIQQGNRDIASQLDELNKLSQEAASQAKANPQAGATPNATADPAEQAEKTEGSQPPGDGTSGDNAAAQPNTESGLLNTLIGTPWIPGVAAGLLAAMAGLAAWRVRQRRKQNAQDAQDPQSTSEATPPQAPLAGLAATDLSLANPSAEASSDTPTLAVPATWQPAAPVDDPSTAPMSALPPGLPSLDLDLNLDLEVPDLTANLQADLRADPPTATPTASPVDLTTDLNTQAADFSDDEPTTLTSAPSPLPFDLAGLSLDLDVPDDLSAHSSSDARPTASQDALTTKLALAQEFMAMGDKEGARALVDEVLANSSGELRAQAEALLFELA